MAAENNVDLRDAINAISDVIQNRPRPIREYDQIFMKAADMVIQSEIIADWADGKSVAFMGDGDGISVCVAHLKEKGILDHGPSRIEVFDFDERITAVVRLTGDGNCAEGLMYRAVIRAKLVYPYFIRLMSPIPMPKHLAKNIGRSGDRNTLLLDFLRKHRANSSAKLATCMLLRLMLVCII